MEEKKSISIVKPLLKWVGGKTQILDKIFVNFPNTLHNYYEVFLGGGSVLLGLLSKIKSNDVILTGKIYAFDLNPTLINLYKNIQSDHIKLYDEVQKLIKDFISLDLSKQKEYYYHIRKTYNNAEEGNCKSAMFLFLNKTCFRGLCREGPNK